MWCVLGGGGGEGGVGERGRLGVGAGWGGGGGDWGKGSLGGLYREEQKFIAACFLCLPFFTLFSLLNVVIMHEVNPCIVC